MTENFSVITVIQGEAIVSDDPSVVLMTVLGSCIAVCMYDSVAKVGGMNHFLLPGDANACGSASMRFGANSMEMLINGILKKGGDRSRLACKAFGGAAVVPSLGRVGQENVQFVTEYLKNEGITCVSQSFWGTQARRVRFWPTTGRAQQNLVQDLQKTISQQEESYRRREMESERKWTTQNTSSDVELF
ncbi:MAG: chemotaxis protein CheD [Acetobacter sp.]|nr:chemotaxis protein CheD [Acetobacter sp.]